MAATCMSHQDIGHVTRAARRHTAKIVQQSSAYGRACTTMGRIAHRRLMDRLPYAHICWAVGRCARHELPLCPSASNQK
eukprot:1591595-Prymnesium_polylepis.1